MNIALQSIIENRYPKQYQERKNIVQKLLEDRQVTKDSVDNIPVLTGYGMHLMPGMNEILTIKGRVGHDLIHQVT